MANDRRDVIETLLKFSVDRPALSTAQQGVEAIKREFGKMGSFAEASVRGVRSGFKVLGRDLNQAKGDVADLKEELRELGKTNVKPKIEISTSDRLGKASTGLGALASGAGALGIGGEGLRAFGDIAGAGEQLGALKESILGLGPAGAIGAAALVAIAIALSEYNKALEKQKQGLSAALNAQDEYYRAVSELSAEQAQEEIDRRRKDNETLAQQLEETRSAIANVWEQSVAQFGDAGARILVATGQLPTAQLEEQLKKLQTEYDTNTAAAARLEQGLKDGAFATNDAAAAEDKLTQSRLAGIDHAIQREIEAQRLIREGSTKQVTDRIQANLDEINANNSVIEQLTVLAADSEEAAARLDLLNARNQELIASNDSLIRQVQPLVSARENEAKAAQTVLGFFQSIPGALASGAKEASKIASSLADFSKAAQESNARLAEISAEYASKVADAERERQQALADADREAAQARNDAVRKAAMEREDAEREHQQNLAKIQRDFQRASSQAISDRNVVAYTQAQQARDDANADENQNYANRRRDINRNLQETLRDINVRLNEQHRTIAQRYNEQLQTAYDAAAKARQIEQQKAQAELQIKSQAAQQQIQIAVQGAAGVSRAIGSIFANLNRAASGIGGGGGGGSSPVAAAGASLGSILGGIIPHFANEGYITRSGLANVHKGEVVMKASRLQNNNMNNSFTINGSSRKQVQRQVHDYLDDMMTAAGW